MEEPSSSQKANAAVQSAERLGVVVVPALLGLGYGVYLLITERMNTTNGVILSSLGLVALVFTSAFDRTRLALIPAFLLGIYMFGVIGCIALALAISENSGWRVMMLALLWTILGWRLLAGAQRLRRT